MIKTAGWSDLLDRSWRTARSRADRVERQIQDDFKWKGGFQVLLRSNGR